MLDTAERGLFESVGRLLGLFIERTRAEASLRELNVELGQGSRFELTLGTEVREGAPDLARQ